MDVSEGRKALHHRQARSIHERKLISLSLRAVYCCFDDSTCHQPVMAASSLKELAAMRNLATCELGNRRHLVTDVRTSKRHMESSKELDTSVTTKNYFLIKTA